MIRSRRGSLGRTMAASVAWTALTLALAMAAISAPAPSPSTAARKPAIAVKPAPAKTGTGTAKKPASAARRPVAASNKSVLELAREAREVEDAGGYARALVGLRALRARVLPDADLELFLALDEARAGRTDSARVRLSTPLMDDAVKDTLPTTRRVEYPYRREGSWLNGHYDGWPWYIWRARAELASGAGRWSEAYDAARRCVEARPLSGKEWLVLAVAAAHTQRDDESRQAAARASTLDPTLPEAHYLLGLWDWKAGRRGGAQEAFRRAVRLDSTFVPGALAMVRSRLPGIAPDSLPTELLTGPRRAALITAPYGPKPEEYVQVDVPAVISYSPDSMVTDSLVEGVKPLTLIMSLLIDERGRPVVNDLPWFHPALLPEWKITRLLNSVPSWRFTPAIRLGSPHPVWISMDFNFMPATAGGAASVRKE